MRIHKHTSVAKVFSATILALGLLTASREASAGCSIDKCDPKDPKKARSCANQVDNVLTEADRRVLKNLQARLSKLSDGPATTTAKEKVEALRGAIKNATPFVNGSRSAADARKKLEVTASKAIKDKADKELNDKANAAYPHVCAVEAATAEASNAVKSAEESVDMPSTLAALREDLEAERERLAKIKDYEAARVTADKALREAEEAISAADTKIKDKASHDDVAAAVTSAKEALDKAKEAVKAAPDLQKDVAALCEASCHAPDAYCIDVETGDAFCRGDKHGPYDLPSSIGVGTSLTVRVIGPEGSDGQIEIATNFVRSLDQLFSGAAKADGVKAKQAGAEKKKLIVLKALTTQVPDETGLTSLRISYKRTFSDGRTAIASNRAVDVDHGKYYIEVGILAPIVYRGQRTVGTTKVPGTGGERSVTVTEDWAVKPALALNVFPAGRRRGLISSFQNPGCRTFGDLLGLQAAVDLDFTKAFERMYFGAVIEPVAGLSANLGLALVRGQELPRGVAEGMLVPKGETVDPATKYMPRFYFGFTLTTDILNTVATATNGIKGIKF
jgi:hypothetical protein